MKKFYLAAWQFYIAAADYALSNLPIKDDLLTNAESVYFPRRAEAAIAQVAYFISWLGDDMHVYSTNICVLCMHFSNSAVLKYSLAKDLNSIEMNLLSTRCLKTVKFSKWRGR